MGCPPNHKVDHVPKLILSFDDAWDHERLNRETATMKGERTPEDGEGPLAFTMADGHPWARFCLGLTRGDIDAVRGYLLPGSTPWEFSYRRLSLAQWAVYKDRAATSPYDASLFALRFGLLSVDGVDYKPTRGGSENGGLDQSDLDRLRALVGDLGISELANMAIECSRELLEAEKKP
jgi:hypothetical protein